MIIKTTKGADSTLRCFLNNTFVLNVIKNIKTNMYEKKS